MQQNGGILENIFKLAFKILLYFEWKIINCYPFKNLEGIIRRNQY